MASPRRRGPGPAIAAGMTPIHNAQPATPFSTPTSRSTGRSTGRSIARDLLPPPTPLPMHPADQYPAGKILSTAATAFALKAYLETLLHGLGWDPAAMTVQDFVTQYSWLLSEELDTTPERAAAIFLEIFDKTTPDLRAVCHAIIGVEDKLRCSRETSKAIRHLFKRNHEVTPETMLEIGGDKLDEKVGSATLKGRKEGLGGGVAIWKRIFGGLFREMFGKKKKGKGKEWEQ
ncbi:uncharacterized protein LAJ45_02520 [Morchella importuna]|uniref:Uncharacterized protein n=1 Tax=Morchella conica CCBAS932 TaxID=1392247 RepID=A0A3N4KZF3_9PEZI|nr:uncharacterized protein LAJ45_02520 [Morchella importuna]KAH8153707.1 hypothetical protein LAJ45_02520 [Morchella importuna]RPB14858.1 hypothetical protein P167DRAFT_543565 [Morchella conica CCBAS932]